MSKYSVQTMSYSALNGKMRLPNYQRPLVWSKTQKEKFIDNISKGFPFGSLLLYQYELGEPYTLIDGQQRYTTLQEYERNPEQYFPLDDFGFMDELLRASGASEQPVDPQSKLRLGFGSIVREMIKKKTVGEKLEGTYLAEKIREIFPMGAQDTGKYGEIVNIQMKLLDALKEYVDLDVLQIPCVIFEGEKSELPEVFANVNLGGRKLTKYQVFAAQWDRYSVQLANGEYSEQILEKTIDRYERLTNDRGGLVIEDFSPDEMRDDEKVSLPEFCHALGELVIEGCPACWPPRASESDDAVDTVGYNTLGIVFGIRPQDIATLPDRFAQCGFENAPDEINDLLNAIMSEYREINGSFARFLRRPGTYESYETSKTNIQLQFLSFFAALWRLRYQPMTSTALIVHSGYRHKGYEASLANIFPSFLYDMLTNQWKGSGDSRLANYIQGSMNYLSPIDKDRLLTGLSFYLEECWGSESINVDPIAKTLVTVYASGQPAQYQKSKYDYEHLIPRDTLNKKHGGKAAYKKFKLPGGSLGNIANLDAGLNRAKGSRTLPDHAGEMFHFDGSREKVDSDQLKEANLQLQNGNPEPAKEFIRQREAILRKQIAETVCR